MSRALPSQHPHRSSFELDNECCVSIEAYVILPFQACNFAFMAGFFGLKHRDLVRKIVLFTAKPNNIYYFPSREQLMNHS